MILNQFQINFYCVLKSFKKEDQINKIYFYFKLIPLILLLNDFTHENLGHLNLYGFISVIAAFIYIQKYIDWHNDISKLRL